MTELNELFPNDYYGDYKDLEELDRDDVVGVTLPCLDKGYVQLVDFMGDDMSVVDGARTSFRESGEKFSERRNRGLINYLVEHRHTSPIELPALTFRVKVPMFVRAQHVRHRTQSCNWESHRYQEAVPEFYIPPQQRWREQDVWNKQGSGDMLEAGDADTLTTDLISFCDTAWHEYLVMLEHGVSRELARMVLPTNYYTTGVFSMNLRNLLHYLKLREDPHAQPEIRALAHNMGLFVKKLFPITYKAWEEYDRDSVTFSSSEHELLIELIGHIDEEVLEGAEKSLGGSKRRLREFIKKISST